MHKRLITAFLISAIFSVTDISSLTVNPLYAQQAAPVQPQTQNQPAPQPPQPQPVQPLQPQIGFPQPAPAPAAKQPSAKKNEVSFNFDDADVFSVIQTIFGDILKVNYVVDPRVKGRVNFRSVAPVAREDVLPIMEVILRLNGIGIVAEGGLFRLVPISDISREPAMVGIGREPESVMVTGMALLQVVPVQYIQSSEMVRILTPFLSANAVIVDVPKSNHIIIVDTDTNVQKLLLLVKIFDNEQTKKASPHVFVYPVQNSKAKDIATLLQQIFLGAKPATPAKMPTTTQKASTQATPAPQPQVSMGTAGSEALVSDITRIFPDEVTNSIIILATPEDYAIIAETIKKIDVMPRQVVIEALIARVDLTDKLNFGMQWTIQNDLKIKGLKPFDNDINISGPLKLDTTISSPTFTFTAYDIANNIKLLLQSLATDGKAKILASPHILVSDNREARIQVGAQIPLATSTTTTPVSGDTTASSTITSTVQYKDVGIILKVKPQVNDSGLVSLEISQEVSSRGEKVTIAGQEFESINKTEATTSLVAQDGQTIVIGGLIREDATESKSGIPLLSRIPILGYLFGSTIDESTRNELIILLTPHVIRNQKEAQEVTSDYLDRYKGGTKDKDVDKFIKDKKQKEQGDKDAGGRDSPNNSP